MARIRTIKPELPQSESIGAISRDARLLFIQLFTIADDAGRFRAASRLLASLLYPYDADAAGLIGGWMDELESKHMIRRYEVEGNSYAEITKWLEHQKIDRPSPSRLPEYREASTDTREPSRAIDADLVPSTCTKTSTKEETKTANAVADKKFVFEGEVIKLNQKNYSSWLSAYTALNLKAELVARDDWLAARPPDDPARKNWFVSTSKYLANRNAEAIARIAAAAAPPERSQRERGYVW